MARSVAASVDEYLNGLPDDRHASIAGVREVILRHLPQGYVETMGWGMITYCIPLERYPQTYNGQPLCYAGLAAQKNHNALYLMGAYADPALLAALKASYERVGQKMDMGKSCLRFHHVDDLPLEVIGTLIGSLPPETFIRRYEAARSKARPRATKATRGKRAARTKSASGRSKAPARKKSASGKKAAAGRAAAARKKAAPRGRR